MEKKLEGFGKNNKSVEEGLELNEVTELKVVKYALIAGLTREFTYKHLEEYDYSDHLYVVKYLGIGVLKDSELDNELYHFYLETDELNDKTNKNKNEEITMSTVKDLVVEENIDTTTVEINDDTIEKVLMESPDSVDRLNVLINYSQLSLNKVFNTSAENLEETALGVQTKLAELLNKLLEMKLLSEEDKKAFITKMEAEMLEYQKIASLGETLSEEIVKEAKSNSTSSNSDDSSWILWLIGGVAVAAIGYAAYRYLNPEDVIIDMSTMNLMSR